MTLPKLRNSNYRIVKDEFTTACEEAAWPI